MISFEDDEEEYLYTSNRPHRRSKEEAIYGVFLSSDEDDNRDARGRGQKRFRSDAPVRFVSASNVEGTAKATKSVTKLRKKVTSSDEEILRNMFPEDLKGAGIVVGYASSSSSSDSETPKKVVSSSASSRLKFSEKKSFSTSQHEHRDHHHQHHHPGLGSMNADTEEKSTINESLENMSDSDDQEQATTTDNRFKFAEIAQEMAQRAKSIAHKYHEGMAPTKMSRIYGKGFSMLKKMGYSGGGLGKEGSGIVNPLEAKVRQKHRGLQDSGEKVPDKKPAMPKFYEPTSAVDILIPKPKNDRRGNWRRDAQSNVKNKIVYRTAAEIAAESRLKEISQTKSDEYFYNTTTGEEEESDIYEMERSKHIQRLKLKQLQATGSTATLLSEQPSSFRIVDMTGPEQRIISDANDLRKFNNNNHQNIGKDTENMTSNEFPRKFESNNLTVDDFGFVVDQPTELAALSELKYNIKMQITKIESQIANHARQKVLEENRFQKALNRENELKAKLSKIAAETEEIRQILKKLKTFRNSEMIITVERELDQINGTPLRVTTADMLNRRAAILKYQSTSSSCDDNEMQLSDEDNISIQKDEGIFKSVEKIISFDVLFNEISNVFKELQQQHTFFYYNLSIYKVGSQLGLAVLKYFDHKLATEIHPSEVTIPFRSDSMYLTTLLANFKDNSFPICPQSFRESFSEKEFINTRNSWQEIIESRAFIGLRRLISHVTINPGKQDLCPLLKLLDWLGSIPIDIIVNVLKDEFFPKWRRVLDTWLASPNVDLEEIYIWYNGWRSLFPNAIAIHPIIQAEFMKGLQKIHLHLEHMNSIAAAAAVAEAEAPKSNQPEKMEVPIIEQSNDGIFCWNKKPFSDILPPAPPKETRPEPPSVEAASAQSRLSGGRLIEVLEAVAERNNLLMMPKYGRRHNGKQIYVFGKASIYVDLGVVYCLSPHSGDWECIKPENLLEKSKQEN